MNGKQLTFSFSRPIVHYRARSRAGLKPAPTGWRESQGCSFFMMINVTVHGSIKIRPLRKSPGFLLTIYVPQRRDLSRLDAFYPILFVLIILPPVRNRVPACIRQGEKERKPHTKTRRRSTFKTSHKGTKKSGNIYMDIQDGRSLKNPGQDPGGV